MIFNTYDGVAKCAQHLSLQLKIILFQIRHVHKYVYEHFNAYSKIANDKLYKATNNSYSFVKVLIKNLKIYNEAY